MCRHRLKAECWQALCNPLILLCRSVLSPLQRTAYATGHLQPPTSAKQQLGLQRMPAGEKALSRFATSQQDKGGLFPLLGLTFTLPQPSEAFHAGNSLAAAHNTSTMHAA